MIKKILLLIFITTTGLFSQTFWERTEPYSFALNKFLFVGNDTVYGTLNSGFTRSTDKGLTWSNPIIVNFINNATVSPNGMIFVSQNQNKVSRSTNKGVSWTQVGTGITENATFGVTVTSNGTVLVGAQSGIYRSTNNGDHWTKVAGKEELTDTVINVMSTYDGVIIYAVSTNYDISPNRNYVYRSTDHGLTWTRGTNSVDTTVINKIFIHPNGTIFAKTNNGVRLSTDQGNTWNYSGFYDNSMDDIYISSNGTIFVTIFTGSSTARIMYQSTNLGSSWDPVNTPFGMVFNSLGVSSEGNIFLGADQTYRSTDNGATWKMLPISYPDVRNFFEHPSFGLYMATGATYGYLYKSTDFGLSWKAQNINVLGTPRMGFYADTMFVSDTFYPATLRRSTNNGETWHNYSVSGLGGSVQRIFATPYHVLFAGTSNGIYRSTNHGKNWSNVYTGGTFTSFYYASNGTLVASRDFSGGGVVRSIDSGKTWTSTNTGLTSTNVRSFVASKTEDFYVGTASGIFRSTNFADSWVRIDTQLSSTYRPIGEFITINNDGVLFVGGKLNSDFQDVYKSTNNGASWSLLPSEISSIGNGTNIRSLYVASNGTLFAGTVNGLFRSKNVTTQVNQLQGEVPSSFFLEQNFPNPFNPSTEIRYQTSEFSNVTLKIYDMIGREVTTLVNEVKEAGYYSATFNAKNLASGIYFVRLQSADKTQLKKMMLLK